MPADIIAFTNAWPLAITMMRVKCYVFTVSLATKYSKYVSSAQQNNQKADKISVFRITGVNRYHKPLWCL